MEGNEKLDSDRLKKSVNNLCVDLISMCDDFMKKTQDNQKDNKLSIDLTTTLIGNILLNFNVNLICLMEKNCINVNVNTFVCHFVDCLKGFFEQTEKEE